MAACVSNAATYCGTWRRSSLPDCHSHHTKFPPSFWPDAGAQKQTSSTLCSPAHAKKILTKISPRDRLAIHSRRCRWLVPNGSIEAVHATMAPSARIVQGRVLQKTWRPVDGFLPSRTTSCTAHAGYDVTASQARLHVGGEAAIPLRSSQPCCRLGRLPPRAPFASVPSGDGIVAAGEVWEKCPTGGGGSGYLGFAVHARQARIQRSLPGVLSLGEI